MKVSPHGNSSQRSARMLYLCTRKMCIVHAPYVHTPAGACAPDVRTESTRAANTARSDRSDPPLTLARSKRAGATTTTKNATTTVRAIPRTPARTSRGRAVISIRRRTASASERPRRTPTGKCSHHSNPDLTRRMQPFHVPNLAPLNLAPPAPHTQNLPTPTNVSTPFSIPHPRPFLLPTAARRNRSGTLAWR